MSNVDGTVFQNNLTRNETRLNRAMGINTKQHLSAEASYQYAKKDQSQVWQTTESDQHRNVETRNWSRRKNIQGEKDIKQDGSELYVDTGTEKTMDINNENITILN